MGKQAKKATKKRGRPGFPDSVGIHTRFPPSIASALDAWIAAQPDPKPSRPEAIRRLVEQALAAKPKR